MSIDIALIAWIIGIPKAGEDLTTFVQQSRGESPIRSHEGEVSHL
jgi:hypothetical protein